LDNDLAFRRSSDAAILDRPEKKAENSRLDRPTPIVSFLLSLLLLLPLMGCYGTVHNMKATDDLRGKKVLAGRILFYDNDAPGKDSSRKFTVFFNKIGDDKPQALAPDHDGYVYVPVYPGKYNFGCVRVEHFITGSFIFNLLSVPSVTVNDNDAVVNFGTFHVRFQQSTGSKIVSALVGGGRGYITVDYMPDYDVTSPAIMARIGAVMPFRDENVSFFRRADETRSMEPQAVSE
jgi:hypothetical protein